MFCSFRLCSCFCRSINRHRFFKSLSYKVLNIFTFDAIFTEAGNLFLSFITACDANLILGTKGSIKVDYPVWTSTRDVYSSLFYKYMLSLLGKNIKNIKL